MSWALGHVTNALFKTRNHPNTEIRLDHLAPTKEAAGAWLGRASHPGPAISCKHTAHHISCSPQGQTSDKSARGYIEHACT